ncbi:MAG: hypothetical protein GKR94_04780 [Gammaproteobacteria bacterium]|nr:hypothetical protein [Gammaproteobacteria bacterium]
MINKLALMELALMGERLATSTARLWTVAGTDGRRESELSEPRARQVHEKSVLRLTL